MKVRMIPSLATASRDVGGISTVVKNYHRLAGEFDIEFVDGQDFDVEVIHAASEPFSRLNGPNLSMNHGLYWHNQQKISAYESHQNKHIVDNLRHARVTTTPSEWVAQAIRRDMRINPIVIPHGVDWQSWQHSLPNEGYVLWNKNRSSDVCTPEPVMRLAARRTETIFMTTFGLNPPVENVLIVGKQQYEHMQILVQRCAVYLATAPETWGIGTVEAMAAGKPILGFSWGNNPEVIQHGVNGYLARPGDWEDLAAGLDYCLAHAESLGANGREMARQYTWEAAMAKFRDACQLAMIEPRASVSVVIPCFNKQQTIGRAIHSALAQDSLDEVIVVDDGSTDDSAKIIKEIADGDSRVRPVLQRNRGVANARNRGVQESSSDFVVLLDGDDHIRPEYVATTLPYIIADNSLGVVYTGMRWTNPDGTNQVPEWPGEYNFDEYLARKPQVSTCALVRKSMWQRLGGQRTRYCERLGAGSEDAEFWFRAGAYGIGFMKVTDAPLFEYSSNSGITYQAGYEEADWQGWHSWQKTGQHPFASLATPERIAHPVIARDRPNVSVIIPCGQDHIQYLVDALDSLDGQTYNRWEAIVVLDMPAMITDEIAWLFETFPHVHFLFGGGNGTGAARNQAVQYAKADLLYFLDADDWLKTEALETVLKAYAQMGGNVAIYSDYFSVAHITPDKRDVYPGAEIFWDAVTGKQVKEGRQQEYDCQTAQGQPTNPPYFWAIASALIPKAWHQEIGGFDEELPTWEDYLYFIRLARHGKCFVHVPEMVYVYQQNRGERRALGYNEHEKLGLFDIIREKRGDITQMCNCGPKVAKMVTNIPQTEGVPDGFVEIKYMPGRMGKHMVVINREKYGYRQQGQVFPVKKSHVKLASDRFVCPKCDQKFSIIDEATGRVECTCQTVPIPEVVATAAPTAPLPMPPPPPKLMPLTRENFTVVPGIGERAQENLYQEGIISFAQLRTLTVDDMKSYGIVGMWPKKVKAWLAEN
jgi:glycosyltransferase involved in cell wall biosynthesis